MPRAAKFKIAALHELLRQLEYAPEPTRRRQMDAAERLIADLDPAQNYPQDFIIFRITGYRPDHSDALVTFVGEALLPDLVNLVQTLSQHVSLVPAEVEREPLTLEQVAARLNVSHKTVQRYRKQGLVCHYMKMSDGETRLGCFADALERFAATRRPHLHKAAAFSRINGDMEAQIIHQARALRESEHLSLNEAAQRLAGTVNRAHETIRQVLRRHDRQSATPIFVERGPLSPRDLVLIHRAWRRGVEPAFIARRFGKSRSTIHRAINRRRRDLLRSWSISHVHLPTFDLPDAERIILAAPAVNSALNVAQSGDAMKWIALAQEMKTTAEDSEAALAAGYNLLKRRAQRSIAALGEWPSSDLIDSIETDLRWASRLQRKLIMQALPAAIRRIEQNLHCALRDQLPDEITALLQVAISVSARSVEGLDPARGQKLDGVVGLAMDKALAKIVMPQLTERAAARRATPRIVMAHPLVRLQPWDATLELRPDLHTHRSSLDEPATHIIDAHFGLGDGRPFTRTEIAAQLDTSPVKIARQIQCSLRDLRARVRRG